MVASLVKSLHWTVVVPLPVIMELDKLAPTATPLGEVAQGAVAFLAEHIRTHATALKVLTSRGNYLYSLNVRAEQVDFDDRTAWERNMDDLILRAAIWQDEHWTDRSTYLTAGPSTPCDTSSAAKVVLLSLDRNRTSPTRPPPFFFFFLSKTHY